MKFVKRIKNKVKWWLINKLTVKPELDCPRYDECQEKWMESMMDELDTEESEPYIPWSDLD